MFSSTELIIQHYDYDILVSTKKDTQQDMVSSTELIIKHNGHDTLASTVQTQSMKWSVVQSSSSSTMIMTCWYVQYCRTARCGLQYRACHPAQWSWHAGSTVQTHSMTWLAVQYSPAQWSWHAGKYVKDTQQDIISSTERVIQHNNHDMLVHVRTVGSHSRTW